MAKPRVRAPDGREWTIRVQRVRMPAWHHSRYDPFLEDDGILGLLAFLLIAPFFWLVFPLVRAVVETCVAAARSLFSKTRWVVAVSGWPEQIKLIWKTDTAQARAVAAHVASALSKGYEDLTPPGAELVHMTRPPGLDDLDR